jgi:Heavy metal binding domain
MDPDVVEDQPGLCPRCRMRLEAVRLDTAYSCPVHTFVVDAEAGRCRVCKRELVPITVSLWFACRGDTTSKTLAPGACPDGSPRTVLLERRAHGDHNPKHGGQFFMASDNWHHVEGTVPRPGVFRLYVYDDFTRPLPTARLREVHARASVTNGNGAEAPDGRSIRLVPSNDGRSLEARVALTVPINLVVRLSFGSDSPEQRFDFAFASLTQENTAATASANAPPPPRTASTGSLLDRLMNFRRDVDTAVATGAYGAVYIPALSAKDVALELERSMLERTTDTAVSTAVKRIVIAAWQLDAYGDLGDRENIEYARAAFDAAVDDLARAAGR